jgi:hypothetical protein
LSMVMLSTPVARMPNQPPASQNGVTGPMR